MAILLAYLKVPLSWREMRSRLGLADAGVHLRDDAVVNRLARVQVYSREHPYYAATYGAIGGVMVLMLWLYISGAVILLGIAVTAARSG